MILKKLLSKRAQISMEIGILVAAAVAVAAIAAYFYVSNVRTAANNTNESVNNVTSTLSNVAENYANRISTILSNTTGNNTQ